ncbi:MAG: hypothetical protein L3J97_01480 [Thermoplasmata archaeon]|nr:hypothetical protein [Thermoplasmata archaeon]
MESAAVGEGVRDLVEARMIAVLDVAGEVEVPVELDTLLDLLPDDGPRSAEDLHGWMRTHPGAGRVRGAFAVPPDGPDLAQDASRRERGVQYVRAAQDLMASDLRTARPWISFVGVTGSTAYRDPKEGDDCDLMAIVRPGTVWLFLAYVFFRLRLARGRNEGRSDPAWCFNYTLDEAAAVQEFARPRGFLFAREALVARPVEGEAYYRGLLRRGAWLRAEAPRLYARWESTGLPEPRAPRPVARGVRWVNGGLFLAVASYMQLKGLWANHRLRRAGRGSERFRTVTRVDRMSLETARFERLSDQMGPATKVPPE